jgi:hypothetical protein
VEHSFIQSFSSFRALEDGLIAFFGQFKETDISMSIHYFNLMRSEDEFLATKYLVVAIYSLDAIQ